MMRWGLVAVLVVLPRCSGCLPPLLVQNKVPTPAQGGIPQPSVASENCTSDADCTSGVCCLGASSGVCGACCQSSDCASGVCDSASHTCTTCGASATAVCGASQVCCAPGTPSNSGSANDCVAGSCCSDGDCTGNSAGPHCISGQCAIATCTGAGACDGGLCCNGACVGGATCCSASDCASGQLCSGNACVACDDTHACGAGAVCCGGACTTGTCCSASDCPAEKTCSDHNCASCNLAANDCGNGESCCADTVLGPICIASTGCCPSDTTACGSSTTPDTRACSADTDTCGKCGHDARCGDARTCCSDGACAQLSASPAALGAECCTDAQCVSGICAAHVCSECRGSGLCGTATASAGVQVCDPTTSSCVACDATHACGTGDVCCGGACFSGACCANSDCPSMTPVCDPATKLCTGCALDSDCGAGEVCVAASGNGACAGPNENCVCHEGGCHEQDALTSNDCSGACCAYQCTFDGTCCADTDCNGINPGANPASECTSAQTAPVKQTCTGSVCGCPVVTAGLLYVDPTGSDGAGNGSSACPFQSITQALATATSGTTVNVRPGTYASGEVFPLVVPAGVTLTRDETCTSGSVAIVRNDGSTTSCPLQRASGNQQSSCAVAVSASGVTLADIAVKNTSGWAIAFGSGADASTALVSGVIGCEGAGCSANGGADLAFVGSASPTIGPADASSTLTLSPATNAIVVSDSASPLIRNLQNLVGFSSDVLSIGDTSSPTLRNLTLDWPSGAGAINAGFGVNITGSGGAVTIDHVWMSSCAQGGVHLSRSGTGVHTWNDLRVLASQGDPNTTHGYGVLLDAPSGTANVNLTGGAIQNNNSDGITVDNAVVTISGTLITGNGQFAGSGCVGGNGVTINTASANVAISGATITGSLGNDQNCIVGTGNGIRIGQGSATITGNTIANNAFDGVRAEARTTAASVSGNVISGNGANGIDLLETPVVQLGACSTSCSGGDNIFDCAVGSGASGNARANLCISTPFPYVSVNQLAQNNQWSHVPPTVAQQEGTANNASCATGTSADVVIVQPAFGLGESSVTTAPEQTALTCP